MKISVGPKFELILEEVYNGVLLRTSEGNGIGVCMRDDTLEINIIPKGSKESNWWRVNMQSGKIEKMEDKNKKALVYLVGLIALPNSHRGALRKYIENRPYASNKFRESLVLILALTKDIAFGKSKRFNESMIIVQALLDSQNPESDVANVDGT